VSRNFHVILERDPEGGYVASVPALPGCHTQARSLDELTERIEEAIELYLDVTGEPSEPLNVVGIPRVRVTLRWYDEEEESRRYVWGYCTHLMTDLERCADRVAFVRAKTGQGREGHKPVLLKMLEATEGPDVDRALSAGWDAFRQSVFQRILSENGDHIFNRCPQCRRIVRTPRARQCYWCGHDWHGTSG
jgi:predicted RNase H-like HicB family nuclease